MTDTLTYAQIGNKINTDGSVTSYLPPVKCQLFNCIVIKDVTTTLDAYPALPDSFGSVYTIMAYDQPQHGSVTTDSTSQFIYTPSAGFAGYDFFIYYIQDSMGRTGTGTINITVM